MPMHIGERCQHLHEEQSDCETADVVQLSWAGKVRSRLPSDIGNMEAMSDTDLLYQLPGNQRRSQLETN